VPAENKKMLKSRRSLALTAVWARNLVLCCLMTCSPCLAATAGQADGRELVIAAGGKTEAVVLVSPQAGRWERRAAADLAKYVGLISGGRPAVADTRQSIDAAIRSQAPLLVVGQEVFRLQPDLRPELEAVLKKKPLLRTDGILLRRVGRRVFLAGNNDAAHYFAVAELLRRWGCRWYLPTEFGECIPQDPMLKVGVLQDACSSPFEIRSYWISWVGDKTGAEEFQLRNMMTGRADLPPTGHALGKYTKGLGQGTFHFPITDLRTAQHVAAQVEKMYAAGQMFSLGMEDGSYDSEDPKDQRLMKLQWDKYFMRWSVTDPMLELYNNVAKILQRKYPESRAKIGFLAYANMTIPPKRTMTAERSLFCELAPIDIDPIHGMDSIQSAPRREFRDMLHKWARVMQGRLCIYDYDQGMLVWRDLPNPSHQAFRQDVRQYLKAGILGVNTESRNAIATTFLNLHIRGRLLWDPATDVDQLLEEFYPKFYGPAAVPMRDYWTAIYDAWAETICTEHEFFVAPAIYTPQVLSVLREKLTAAEQIITKMQERSTPLSRNEHLYVKRMVFTRYSHDVIAGYMKMVQAAAGECDYARAVAAGQQALSVREKLTDMNGTFTTYRNYKVEQNGYAWWPGEVRQYRELLPLIDGTRGRLIAKLPLNWAARRDADNKGLERGFASASVDLSHWRAHGRRQSVDDRRNYPDAWEMLRSDLYAQAQGVRHADRQSFVGHLWYRTEIKLTADQVSGSPHLRFPGLFNECWLYVNGKQVGYRKQGKVWWLNDYRFEWDVDLERQLKAGTNVIAVRCNCEHHLGGLFRRPFLYQPL